MGNGRAREQDFCGTSIAFANHSVDPSLSTQLLVRELKLGFSLLNPTYESK